MYMVTIITEKNFGDGAFSNSGHKYNFVNQLISTHSDKLAIGFAKMQIRGRNFV